MRVWIDDLRPPPDATWTWVKTSADALELLCDEKVEELSFDHDLGGDDTSMPVAKWIEEQAFEGKMKPPQWAIHSANPVGRQNLEAALVSADRRWDWLSAKADWT